MHLVFEFFLVPLAPVARCSAVLLSCSSR